MNRSSLRHAFLLGTLVVAASQLVGCDNPPANFGLTVVPGVTQAKTYSVPCSCQHHYDGPDADRPPMEDRGVVCRVNEQSVDRRAKIEACTNRNQHHANRGADGAYGPDYHSTTCTPREGRVLPANRNICPGAAGGSSSALNGGEQGGAPPMAWSNELATYVGTIDPDASSVGMTYRWWSAHPRVHGEVYLDGGRCEDGPCEVRLDGLMMSVDDFTIGPHFRRVRVRDLTATSGGQWYGTLYPGGRLVFRDAGLLVEATSGGETRVGRIDLGDTVEGTLIDHTERAPGRTHGQRRLQLNLRFSVHGLSVRANLTVRVNAGAPTAVITASGCTHDARSSRDFHGRGVARYEWTDAVGNVVSSGPTVDGRGLRYPIELGVFDATGRRDAATVAAGCRGGTGSMGPGRMWHGWFAEHDRKALVGDFDGDGEDDILTYPTGRGDVRVSLAVAGRAFDAANRWRGDMCRDGAVCKTGDVDGDGRDDLIEFTRDSQGGRRRGDVRVALSNGRSFRGPRRWNDWFCIGDEVCDVGDFDGDGRTDIVAFVRSSSGGANRGNAWVALSNGSAFARSRVWHDWFCLDAEECRVGDVDGDGRSDIYAFARTAGGAWSHGNVWVARSTGASFTGMGVLHDWFCIGDEVCEVADVDGDGRDDLLAFVRSSAGGRARGDVWVSQSSGVNYRPSRVWHDWFCIGGETCATGDFDGDGKADMAAFTHGPWGDVWISLAQ